MEKKINLVLIAVIGLTVAFISCKKNDENHEKEDEPKQMIMTTAKDEIWIALAGSGSATIDWGDGSPKETKSVVVRDSWPEFTHIYEKKTTHTITISGNNIEKMMCQGNELITLDVSKNSELTFLYCRINQIRSLNINVLINLEELDCIENQLTSLNLKGLTNLKSMHCDNNKMVMS